MNKICQPLGASSLAVMIVAIAAAVQSGAADDELDTAPAMAAAQSWLGTVDAGRYGQSWEDASKAFREAATKEKWVSLVQPVRGQTGLLIARKVRNARYARDLPNAPAAEYFALQFDTRFERIAHALENDRPGEGARRILEGLGLFREPALVTPRRAPRAASRGGIRATGTRRKRAW
jgi:opacity protein-like surface antigen